MATAVDAGSDHAQQLQNAIQPKLMENGWVTDENDMTLAEYVTMMIVNGKDAQGVQAELGTDLLAIGDDNPEVIDFTRWLFDQVQAITQPQLQQQQQTSENGAPQDQAQQAPTQDVAMDDSSATGEAVYVASSQLFSEHQLTPSSPTGPRSMRNGDRGGRGGRGNRMLNQINRNIERGAQELPDNLRRIKGAAGVGAGRINSHSGRDAAPRGPKNNSNVARGVSRMMNGRGGAQNGMAAMMNANNGVAPGGMDSQTQLQFMQVMEMQANMFQQMLQSMPNQQNGQYGMGHPTRGARGGRGSRGLTRGGRGGSGQTHTPQLHAVDGKMPDGALPSGPVANGGDGMDVDGGEETSGGRSSMFSTPCRFDTACTNAACGFAHRGPRTNPETVPVVDMTATCSYGAKCTNNTCTGRHPSPAGARSTLPCKFYPNCQNASCPFTHPATRPCKNGGDCTVAGCKFGHSQIVCRYNPCLNQACTYKHEAGQKRGKFEDKVWTPGETKTERFAGFKEEGAEELILPGQENQANGAEIKQESQMEDAGDIS